MKKWMLLCALVMLGCFFTGCRNGQIIGAASENAGQEQEKTYEMYVQPFAYQLGAASWNQAEEVEPDGFVPFFIHLLYSGQVKQDPAWPVDDRYGNPMFPEDIFEESVQRHFEVTTEHLRKSQYYDAAKHAYWTGGVGTVVEIGNIRAVPDGELLNLEFQAEINDGFSYRASWNGAISIQITGDRPEDYRYLSFQKLDFQEEQIKQGVSAFR